MKLLHIADIHLGYETYGRLDPATGLNSRLLDFERSFRFAARRAVEEDVDLFLFCGDAYRTPDPTPTQQQLFARCLRPVVEAGIPIVMIVGNHDHPVSFGKSSSVAIFEYLAGAVRVFRRPDLAVLDTKSGPLQLIALPWPIRSVLLSRDQYRNLNPAEVQVAIENLYAEFIESAVRQLDPAVPTVVAGHFTVQGASLGGSERTSQINNEAVFRISQLVYPEIDYVALGHIHKYQDLHPDARPPVVYSGSIERINFREWEDEKGFVLVDIDRSGPEPSTSYAFVPTPARPFVSIQVDARKADDPTGRILAAIALESVTDAIVRIRYQIDEAQVGDVDVRRIRAALDEAHVIASIERTVDQQVRERRTVVTRESSLQEALTQYIAQHEHLAPIKDDLLAAAAELEAEHEAARTRS